MADWDSIIRPDLINIVHYFQSLGVEEFAIFGMCWGGQIATLSAIELSDYFKAGGLVHPAFISNDEAYYVRIPLYLIPTGDGFDMVTSQFINVNVALLLLRKLFSINLVSILPSA